ncbi:MAG TPA: DNA-formamidopyrimidine glycosylase family protein [Jatrophihabitans sp.]|nr:DNA-formamidopyrimidine glycosylase family protein [Jatrophihabitans sp.]
MPEGDTVYITCQRLHRALAGRAVTTFDLRVPTLALADLTGTDTTEVIPRGKHILMRFSDGQTLHSHLRMDGSWRVGPAAARPRGRNFEIRALVGNAEWLASGFRLHDLKLVPTAQEASVVGHLGPDLLASDYDSAEALRRFGEQPDRPIAEALLDQRLVAGIGNVYKSELLFLHGVNPWARVCDVADLAEVLSDAERLLRGNLGDFNRSTTGWRQPGQQYWVYGRAGKACRRCRGAIQRDEGVGAIGGAPEERITFFCPHCQHVQAR